jgi:hypothetical protein
MTGWTCNLVAGVADIAGRVLEKRVFLPPRHKDAKFF